MNETQNTPTPSPVTDTPTPASTRSWLRHPVSIGIGAAGAVIVLVAGVVVIADEIAEEIWPERYYGSDSAASVSGSVPGESASAPVTGESGAPTPVPAPAPTSVDAPSGGDSSVTASDLRAIVDAAVTAASGIGATEIDVSDAVAYVDVLLTDGRELDVYVGPNDAVRVETAGSADVTVDPAIELDRLDDIIAIARGALGDEAATLLSVSTNASASERYEVEWRTEAGSTVWVELTAELAVTDVDRG